MLDCLPRTFESNREAIEPAFHSADIDRINAEGKIASILAIENGMAIDDSLETLRHYYDRGVRLMTLTHNVSTDWCISSADTSPAFSGLSDFGRDVIRAMNDLGMIIDVSHVSAGSIEAILEISCKPIMASHSCVRALCDFHRNLTDEQIIAIAESGGVIGVNFCPDFLSPASFAASGAVITADMERYRRWEKFFTGWCSAEEYERGKSAMQPFLDEWEQAIRGTGVSVREVADHIQYIADLVGPEHVGIGSDFDGISFAPQGAEDCSKLPNLVAELAERGYAGDDLKAILRDNFVRIFRTVCG
jgi:membrane dipeptidase